MAVNSTAFLRQGRGLQGVTAGLISAVCEWLLIFLLFIDAILSYLLTQFSIYCELPVPCILCSRLDHVFGREKPGFYLSLFCMNHKSEISSLVSCEIHGKLADGRGMCENCVLSSVKKHKPNSDAHKRLLSRMGLSLGSHDSYGFQSSFYKGKHTPTYQSSRMCLCCNELWTSKPNLQSPLPLKIPPALVAKPNIPLPRRISRRNSLRKMRDKMSSRGNSRRIAKRIVDPLSHVGYTDLKINSEPESEFPFAADDDELSTVVPDFSDKEESLVHYFATGILPIRVDKMSVVRTNENPEAIQIAHAAGKETLLSNPKPHHVVFNTKKNELAEFNSLDDIPSNAVQVRVDGSSVSHSSRDPGQTDFASHVNTSPTVVFKEIPQVTVDNAEKSNNDGTITETKLETDQGATNAAEMDLSHGNPADISRAATGDEEREGLEPSEEQPNMKSKQSNEDRNSVQGRNSLGQETDSSRNNSSQESPLQGNEPDEIHKPYPDEAQNSQASVSPDMSSLSEIEGESIVERLRRQVQHHRTFIKGLSKELEEERNAAIISANEALAMISKLQEEKAAWQMEAHQYLRMMEEQSEHDAEQLEKANDLLIEKEKEIQDLEAELDYYRINYGDDPFIDENELGDNAQFHEVGAQMGRLESNVSEENVAVQNTSASRKLLEPVKVRSNGLEDETAYVVRKSVSFKKYEPDDGSKPKLSDRSVDTDKPAAVLSEIEEEKASILIRLKSLEKKFRQVADPNSPYTPGSVRCTGAGEGRHHNREFTNENGEVSLVMQNGLSNVQGPESKENTSSEGGFNSSPARGTMDNDRSDHQVSSSGENHDGDEDIFSIQSEILELNERFETLESKYNVLDHSNSTQNENEGRKFIREMDVQLRELRRLVSMTRF